MTMCSRRLLAVLIFSLASAIPSVAAAQQEPTVRGVVVDASTLMPISAAQVTVVGTDLGTLSNQVGRFIISGRLPETVVLRVTRIGFQPVETTVQPEAGDVRILLSQTAVELDALVVTGTAGEVAQRSIGNAISSIPAADIVESTTPADLGQLLSGKAPGVVVTPGTGLVGGGTLINIRGSSSLSLSNQPLVYVDGIRVDNATGTGPTSTTQVISRLNDFAPEDIEKIEIIKGPAAATLYGTEASNGVIQILTKKGRDGETRVNAVVEQGANWFPDPEGTIPSTWGAGPSGEIIELDIVERENERGTPIWTTGYVQSYGVNVSGGSSAVRYYLGTKYDRRQGVEPPNGLKRFNGRANLSLSLHPTLQVDANVGYVSSRIGLAQTQGASAMWATRLSSPSLLDTPNRGFAVRPPEAFWAAEDIFQTLERVTASATVKHAPTSWLTQRLVVGRDLAGEDNQAVIERIEDPLLLQFYPASAAAGQKFISRREATVNTTDYTATVTLPIGVLESNTTAGFQLVQRSTESIFANGQEFPAPGLTTVSSTARRDGGDDFVENATVGSYLQQQLAWNDRLFLTAAVRADDNSAFGEEFDFVYYPKVSGAWVLSEEPRWNVDFVDALRLRAAFGYSGLQPDAFAAIRTFRPVTGTGDAGSLTPQSIGNANLKPERSREFEVGFDAELFDRLGLDFTYYNQLTTDAILNANVAPSSGFSGTRFINAGQIRNRGVELGITANIARRPSFGWDLSVNVASNRNEIIDLGTESFIAVGPSSRHEEGYATASYFFPKRVSAELDESGNAINVMCDGGPDRDHEPVPCDQAPAVFLGNTAPTLEGGVSTNITLFERLRLYALVDYRAGHHLFNANDWGACAIFRRCRVNYFPEEFDAVFVAESQNVGRAPWIQPADFAKLRELSLSYTLPEGWIESFGSRRATVTLSGRNLHTWTKYGGLDPELRDPGSTIRVFDQLNLPTLAQFVTRINVSF